MSKAERLAAKITEGIMTGHDHPNLQHELDRMNVAAHLRALDASHQRLVEALAECMDAVEVFHGPDAWDIYRDHSPEMKRWVAALEQAKDLS